MRKREILKSAEILGLRSDDDVRVVEDPAFPDSMQQAWPAERITDVLASTLILRPGKLRGKSSAASNANAVDRPLASIDAIITFDEWGVSRHPNHSSLRHGAQAWLRALMRGRDGWECPVALYALTSTNVIRKYAALLDAPLTLALCVRGSISVMGRKRGSDLPPNLMFFSDVWQWRKAQIAMTSAHQSQMRWFRWGWIVLSRYMVINDLQKLPL